MREGTLILWGLDLALSSTDALFVSDVIAVSFSNCVIATVVVLLPEIRKSFPPNEHSLEGEISG